MSTFESFLYEPGEGVGLTLRRSLYVRANRDLSRAMGNGVYYNPSSPYLPPGIARLDDGAHARRRLRHADGAARTSSTSATTPTAPSDVITLLRRQRLADARLRQVRSVGARRPIRRRSCWPSTSTATASATRASRCWCRATSRSTTSAPTASPTPTSPATTRSTNPDPNGDDYHYLWNPTGTENNWRYDDGEPYEDVGVDGVPMSVGGCQAAVNAPNCYDYGEGNGKFDYTPGAGELARRTIRAPTSTRCRPTTWRASTPGTTPASATSSTRRSRPTASWARSAPRARRCACGTASPPSSAPRRPTRTRSTPTTSSWPALGRHVYVRYGNPDLDEAIVEASGDGRHVGTAHAGGASRAVAPVLPGQPLARRRPRARHGRSAPTRRSTGTFTAASGRMSPYNVILPPGYTQPENASKRYPVVYFMHGYGMDPMGIAQIALIAQNAMVDSRQSDTTRMPKFIIVLVDGKCRPGGDVSAAPLPTDGDLCEEGTFYTDHPEGDAQASSELMQFQDFIDANYRTKAPADLPFTRVATSPRRRRCRSRRCWRRPSRSSCPRR